MSDDFDFGYIEETRVTAETTAEFIFPKVPGEPSIICRPATNHNSAFINARNREVLKEFEGQKSEQKTNAKRIEDLITTPEEHFAQLERQRGLLASTCCVEWGRAPVDGKTGKPVPFSIAAVKAFLTAIPDVMFEGFSNWISNEWNFIREGELPKGAGAGLGESSPNA